MLLDTFLRTILILLERGKVAEVIKLLKEFDNEQG
jgi:hypothetical protein